MQDVYLKENTMQKVIYLLSIFLKRQKISVIGSVPVCKKARAAANIDFATALLNKRRKILFFSVERGKLNQNDCRKNEGASEQVLR